MRKFIPKNKWRFVWLLWYRTKRKGKIKKRFLEYKIEHKIEMAFYGVGFDGQGEGTASSY